MQGDNRTSGFSAIAKTRQKKVTNKTDKWEGCRTVCAGRHVRKKIPSFPRRSRTCDLLIKSLDALTHKAAIAEHTVLSPMKKFYLQSVLW